MHICPECGQACCCGGDIEDHDTGDEYVDDCECCCDAQDSEPDFADPPLGKGSVCLPTPLQYPRERKANDRRQGGITRPCGMR